MTIRLTAIHPSEATGETKVLFDIVQAKLGGVPNLFRTLGRSPAALKGFLHLHEALGSGALDVKLREQIALTVAEENRCEYCLSAHTAIGKRVGLSASDLEGARRAAASDPKVEAALLFARQVVRKRGRVTDEEVERLRNAGYSDGEVAEIVANVALNIFTNYFNHVAGTEVDFPRITPA
jgi:uncharacterized peroxidase-related enzyme